MEKVVKEEWRDVPGYEGIYQVSNCGRVKSCTRTRKGKGNSIVLVPEKYLKLRTDKDGYKEAALSLNGKIKYYRVHRLVAMAFIPNPLNLPVINHKDENPANNFAGNLEWCDNRYNTNYSLYKNSHKVICNGEVFPSIRELCRTLKCDTKSIRYLLKRWGGGLYKDKYQISYYNPQQRFTAYRKRAH